MTSATHKLMTGCGIVSLIIASALISFLFDPIQINIAARLQAPSGVHFFGTDQFGRDILFMLMRGGWASLLVALAAVIFGGLCGISLGIAAAFNRSIAEPVIMRVSDFIFAFPALLIAVLLRETIGSGLLNAIVAIGIFNIPVFTRITYRAALNILVKDYILAARLSGRGEIGIAVDHVLPALRHTLIVQFTIQMALGLLAEASLSYVGLGVVPPMPSWGRMLNDAQTFMAIAPQLALLPGLAIALTVYAFSLIGDSLRDLWDIRRVRQGGRHHA